MIEVLIFGLSSNQGGIETYLLKIWRNIDHKRIHFNFIDICGKNRKPAFYDELSNEGCTFYKITSRRESYLKNRLELSNLFRQHRFDILHFNVNTLSYIEPIFMALRNNCRVIIHSRSSNAQLNTLARYLHQINKGRISKINVTKIAVSEEAGKWLFGNDTFRVFHNGVEIDRFRFLEENRENTRAELRKKNTYVIGHVGTFLPVKNHIFMLNVFQTLRIRLDNVELWFVGDGPLRQEIEREVNQRGISDNVKFLGQRSDVNKLYSGMDLLWLPSLFEGYPNVVIEGLCSGLPCLASAEVPKEVMISEGCRQISLKDDIEIWVNTIIEMLKMDNSGRNEAYIQMRNKGVSVESEIERIEKLYEEVVHKT